MVFINYKDKTVENINIIKGDLKYTKINVNNNKEIFKLFVNQLYGSNVKKIIAS